MMKLPPVRLMWFLLLWGASFVVKGQEYSFRWYNTDDGLPSPIVNVSFQDSKGFIWIGSAGGLSRFDGKTFRNFSREEGLIHNVVRFITEDKQGKIWLGTFNGISVYDGHRFINYHPGQQYKGEYIRSMYAGADGSMWVATKEGLWNVKNNVFTSFGGFTAMSKEGKINLLSEDHKGRMLIGTTKGLFRLEGKTLHPLWNIDSMDINVGSVIANRNGDLFFTSMHTGVYKLVHDAPFPESLDVPAFFPVTLIKTSEHGFVLVSYRELISYENGVVHSYCMSEILNGDNLDEMGFFSAMKDDEGNLWLSTNMRGLYKLHKSHVERFVCSNLLKGLPAPIMLSGDRRRLFVTSSDQVYRLSQKGDERDSNTLEHIFSAEDPSTFIGSVLEDRNGNTWIAKGFNEVVKISPDKKQMQFVIDGMMPGNDFVNLIFQDSKGNLWLGTTGTLYLMNARTNRFEPFPAKDMKKMKGVREIYEHPGAGLFFSCRNGTYQLQQNKLVRIDRNVSNCFEYESDSTFWAGGDGTGLMKYIIGPGYCKGYPVLKEEHGLSSNFIQAISRDKSGTLWLGGNRGISCVKQLDKFNFIVKNLTREDGAHPGPWRDIDIAIDKKGDIWAANGLAAMRINNGNYEENKIPARVYLLSYELESKNGETGLVEMDDISAGSQHTFASDFRAITFNYIGLSFTNPDGVQYAVKLEGLDDNWRYVKNVTSMTYMNLAPGKYTFRVKASNNEGVWADNHYVFEFEVRPPFWQTWWFVVLVILIIPFIAGWIIRNRFKTLSRKARLTAEMAELKMQALRAQMNPHFIFNALNSIQHLIIKKESDLAFSYLSKFSRLLRMILDVSDKAFVSLEKEVEMLQLYLDLEALRFDHHMQYSIEVDEDDLTGISIPTLLIQPYVENAIWHGLVPKRDHRELNIRISITATTLLISIKDNGIGRKRAGEIKSMQPVRYESKGLSISKDRLSILGDSKQSKVEIIDLYDDNGNATGTQVLITMPLQALMNRNV